MPQYAPLSQTDIANLALKEIGQQPIADIDQQQGTAAPACASVFWQAFNEHAQEFNWTCLKKRARLTGLSFGEASSACASAIGWPGCRPSTPPAYWAANTAYVGGTLVTWGEAIYYALYAHTSGTDFINDMTNGLWAQIYSTFISYPGGGADNGLYEWAFGYALPSDFILAQELNGVSCVKRQGDLYELFVNQVTNPDNTITTNRALFTNECYANLKYTARIQDTTVWDALFVNSLAVLIASKIATPLLGDEGKTALQMRARYDREVLPRAKMKDVGSQKLHRYDPTQESDFIRSRWNSTNG